MTFSDQPPDVLLQILSYLRLSTLSCLCATSRSWHNLFSENEDLIYRNAALLHGFINTESAVPEKRAVSQKYSPPNLKEGTTYLDLCKTRLRVRDAWIGGAPSQISIGQPDPGNRANSGIHSIRVDEQRRLVLTASGTGGVNAMDMDSGKLLWYLGEAHIISFLVDYVRVYADIEYSEGFLIFDRLEGGREVWRILEPLSPVIERTTLTSKSAPDDKQLSQSLEALQIARDLAHVEPEVEDSSLRGCFVAYALIRPPDRATCQRFVYPILLTISSDMVYLWDAPSGRLIEVLQEVQGLGDAATTPEQFEIGHIRYADLSPRHVFLAGQKGLKVFARTAAMDGLEGTLPISRLAHLPHGFLSISSSGRRHGKWSYRLNGQSGTQHDDSELVPYEVAVEEKEFAKEETRIVDKFRAVHVSPCGSHFVALLFGCRLLIVPHFERLLDHSNNEEEIYNNTLEVDLGSPLSSVSLHLAYGEGDEGIGRVGVVTVSYLLLPPSSSLLTILLLQSHAVFVLTLPRFTVEPLKDPPKIRVARLRRVMDPSLLPAVSSLILSDTSLFLNWSGSIVSGQYAEQGFRFLGQKFDKSLKDLEMLGDRCFQRDHQGVLSVSPTASMQNRVTMMSRVLTVNFLPSS
ncbi:unnamed protein product [Cyclocybe aegerita]|uniref:F-box domain-containing protein n=1 Tax=Cyclocybe aegerita TaxID=1973307 RepID=A0A8S0W0H8_CYCAE|nr:unnamed protein product [Cyclocybe aegerita]